MEFYQKSSNLRRCLDQIRAGLFSPKQPDLFSDFIDNLLKWDRFKVCADFDSYIECQKEVSKLYMVCFVQILPWPFYLRPEMTFVFRIKKNGLVNVFIISLPVVNSVLIEPSQIMLLRFGVPNHSQVIASLDRLMPVPVQNKLLSLSSSGPIEQQGQYLHKQTNFTSSTDL